MNPLVITKVAGSYRTLKLVCVFPPHETASTRYKYTTGLYGRKITEHYTKPLISGEDLCVFRRPV
jgi:hypothetical protein